VLEGGAPAPSHSLILRLRRAGVRGSKLTEQWEVLEGVLGSATAALQEPLGGVAPGPDGDAAQLLLGQAAGLSCAPLAAAVTPWDKTYGLHRVRACAVVTHRCARSRHVAGRRVVSEGGGGHLPLRWVQVEFCRALLHAAQIDVAVSYMDGSAPGTCPH
jgi:hypothetical protein